MSNDDQAAVSSGADPAPSDGTASAVPPTPTSTSRRRRRRRATRPGTAGAAGEPTSDDTDLGWGEAPDAGAQRDEHERWLHEQRPPHWG